MIRLVSIIKTCQARGCGRRATHELFDEYEGKVLGTYCRSDARLELSRRLEEKR